MQTAKPEAELEILGRLVGSWTGEETMHPTPWSPEGGTAQATVETRWACDGWMIVTEYLDEKDGKPHYRGHGVFGYDARGGRYLQHWSDNMGGMAGEVTRGTRDGDTLTFQGGGPAGHVRYVYVIPDDRGYEFRMEGSRDGEEWTPWMTATYERAPDP